MRKVLGIIGICCIAMSNQLNGNRLEQPDEIQTLANRSFDQDQPQKMQLGRSYYYSLIDKALERRWVVAMSSHYGFTNRSFDNDSQNNSLAHLIFNKDFTIKDIFLFSKLSDDNKVHLTAIPANEDPQTRFERGGTLTEGPNSQPFGNFRDDLYTTLLAPARVKLEAEQREIGFDVSLIYRFYLGQSERVTGNVGITFPLKSRLHLMNVVFIGGSLFRKALKEITFNAQTQTVVADDNTMQQFFNDFADLFDFFERGILQPKGLTFQRRQRKTGIGDIALFGLVDWAHYFDQEHEFQVDSLQTGINLVLPSGNKIDGTKVWQIELGNGGAFQAEVFAHALFKSPLGGFNPSVRLVGSFSAPFTSKRRVPKLKTGTKGTSVQNVSGLLAPARFDQFQVEDFQEFDTSVLHFADQAVSTRTRFGHKVLIGVGNYVYNTFNLGFRFGIFYEFMHKAKDKVKVRCDDPKNFNTQLLRERSERKAHIISWNLTYEFENRVEVNFGSLHIFAGKNMPRHREAFVSLTAVF